jgi:hypothetical protein
MDRAQAEVRIVQSGSTLLSFWSELIGRASGNGSPEPFVVELDAACGHRLPHRTRVSRAEILLCVETIVGSALCRIRFYAAYTARPVWFAGDFGVPRGLVADVCGIIRV